MWPSISGEDPRAQMDQICHSILKVILVFDSDFKVFVIFVKSKQLQMFLVMFPEHLQVFRRSQDASELQVQKAESMGGRGWGSSGLRWSS